MNNKQKTKHILRSGIVQIGYEWSSMKRRKMGRTEKQLMKQAYRKAISKKVHTKSSKNFSPQQKIGVPYTRPAQK